MVYISKIEFKDVTILYDEEKVNKKMCKRKNRLINLWCVISAIIMFALVILGAFITYDKIPEILSILMMLILFVLSGFGLASLGYWLVYHKTIEAFLFVEWLFRMKDVYAGWYNDKILLRVKHSNGIDDYSLQGFLRSIKNELEITDKSNRNKPIHIYIDITKNENTDILIKNAK